MSRILVSVDMEGISGVATRRETATGWPHGTGKGNDYERARSWMTADANAAISGAFEGGATEVLVADAHDGMLNLVWDELDARAELIRGYEGRPAGMIEGVYGCDAAFFVGYHAPAADGRGVLSHTFTGPTVLWNIRLNGEPASEARFNAALAGERGVPVALITGDDVICEQTEAWLPGTETAVVKYALDRYTARCLPQPVALERIKSAARRALERLPEMRPYRLDAPIALEMDWADSSLAAAASRIPGVQRCGDRTVRFEAPDVQTHTTCATSRWCWPRAWCAAKPSNANSSASSGQRCDGPMTLCVTGQFPCDGPMTLRVTDARAMSISARSVRRLHLKASKKEGTTHALGRHRIRHTRRCYGRPGRI